MTEAQLADALFGTSPREDSPYGAVRADSPYGAVRADSPYGAVRAEALLVELDGAPQAAVIWYQSFNTWTGRPGLAVEDVYVREAYRGRGVGQAMFKYLAKLAVERGYARMEWSVLDWNTPALEFYQSLGATDQTDWRRYRLTGDALAALAA
ncbi:MAG: hypothetical protein B7Z80_12320 [Rhodospirillales bacterium 20-64-7]|nr:MAG: hypothetical protein B7Z80_12320 [Rhodospirillales bacterium 20-64-7]